MISLFWDNILNPISLIKFLRHSTISIPILQMRKLRQSFSHFPKIMQTKKKKKKFPRILILAVLTLELAHFTTMLKHPIKKNNFSSKQLMKLIKTLWLDSLTPEKHCLVTFWIRPSGDDSLLICCPELVFHRQQKKGKEENKFQD